MRTIICSTAVAFVALASSPADAVVPPQHGHSPSGLEVPAGTALPRVGRTITAVAPVAASASQTGLLAAGQWRFLWDADLSTPYRIYGSGIDAPGSVADPAAASVAASAFLAEHIALLAPGTSASDFIETINRRSGDVRMVVFGQQHRGFTVEGGLIGFRFKHDRLIVVASEALPNVQVATTAVPASFDAQVAAASWVDSDFAATSTISDVGEAVVFPLVVGPGDVRYRVATPVTVESTAPFLKYTVYVDGSGAVLARRQGLFYNGTVLYNTPERWPGGTTRTDYPASNTNLLVDGQPQTSDGTGLVTFPGASASVDTSVAGPFVTIANQAGANASTTLTLNDADSVTWSEPADEFIDAQLTTYIHLNIAKEYARQYAPGLAWLDQNMAADVNIGNVCNAFSNGDSVFFFAAGTLDAEEFGTADCGNTGRLADVVYHEFGHSLHSQLTVTNFDSAFSEGLSDFYAANIQGDSEMGVGFFLTDESLRPANGPMGEKYWPQDVSTRGPHATGVIFSGSMWDLRLSLLAAHGDEAGQALSDRLFFAAVERAGDIPSTYVEILAEDDDDGNLANGTPNKCLIDFAFGTHGIGESRSLLGFGLGEVEQQRYEVSLPVLSPTNGCPAPEVSAVELTWRLRGDDQTGGTLAMDLSSGAYRATIPNQPEGAVIQYQVSVTYADGNDRTLPLNIADEYYEMFNGEIETLYCTDFETDPRQDAMAWTTGGTFDQWEWGMPAGGTDNVDPPAAFSGNNVFGVALDNGGFHTSDVTMFADSPVIDTSGRTNVRLQYRRWLGTEDERFDQAVIYANGTEKWRNRAGDTLFFLINHTDYEWRFHDVDVSAEAASGSVQLRFEHTADDFGEAGGWNIDDLCVVAFVPSVCGDGNITGNEVCDGGMENSDEVADACRSNCEPAFCGDTVVDTGEECDDGNNVDDDNCSNTCIDLSESGGCGCQSGSGSGAGGLVLLGLVALGLRRRRR